MSLDHCDLHDLGFSRTIFTWNNKRGDNENILERLDRFVVSRSWQSLFGKATNFHMDFWGSDHRVLHLVLDPIDHNNRGRSGRKIVFKCKPWWMKDEECVEVISATWQFYLFNDTPKSLNNGLASCASELSMLGKRKFGVIPRKVVGLQKRLACLYNGP